MEDPNRNRQCRIVFYEDGMATTVTVDRWGKVYRSRITAVDARTTPTCRRRHRRPAAVLVLHQPHAPKAALSATARA
jgi:hypothetical protein